jgi:hypothetical protein
MINIVAQNRDKPSLLLQKRTCGGAEGRLLVLDVLQFAPQIVVFIVLNCLAEINSVSPKYLKIANFFVIFT